MQIKLNGQDIDIENGATLAALLGRHDVTAETAGVAVAVNDTVVPRREWHARMLAAGDRVEIVRAVQGG
jgi:sulfur carrier protein